MSEFKDTFMKFSNSMSQGGAFESLLCRRGRVSVHNDCSGIWFLPLLSGVPVARNGCLPLLQMPFDDCFDPIVSCCVHNSS